MKDILKNKKKLIIFGLLSIIFIIIIILIAYKITNKNNNVTYKEIETSINNKEDIIIYYYSSNSKNKNNKDIKKYLDKLEIRYIELDDKYISKDNYDKFIKLLNINKKLFGCPALLYIKNGSIYADIINIDNEKTIKQFIDNYDLYTVR